MHMYIKCMVVQPPGLPGEASGYWLSIRSLLGSIPTVKMVLIWHCCSLMSPFSSILDYCAHASLTPMLEFHLFALLCPQTEQSFLLLISQLYTLWPTTAFQLILFSFYIVWLLKNLWKLVQAYYRDLGNRMAQREKVNHTHKNPIIQDKHC